MWTIEIQRFWIDQIKLERLCSPIIGLKNIAKVNSYEIHFFIVYGISDEKQKFLIVSESNATNADNDESIINLFNQLTEQF